MPSLEAALGARVGLFVKRQEGVGLLAGCSSSTALQMAEYGLHLWRHDRALHALDAERPGQIVLDTDLVTADERRKSPFYNDFLGSMDAERGVYASFLSEGGEVYYVSGQRSARCGDYEEDEVRLLDDLVPHLRRSLQTWRHLRRAAVERALASEVLDHAGMGVMLVNARSKMVGANSTAEACLEAAGLIIEDGHIRACDVRMERQLRRAIALATQPRAGAVTVELRASHGSLGVSLLVTPCRQQQLTGREPLATLLLPRVGQASTDLASFARAHGLTPAEARLLDALARGERIADYARRSGISPTTAKSHLRALFDKTGERRQADLIRLALQTARSSIEPAADRN
ncbi:hypothetical protein [Sphingomonas sp. ID1715]|uniref:helix-turn-helix transcriptional regulator n=1 Tax=Sphingomonas sp. ID1715 TaxID=1656898 RepID=UPI00148864C1|nr:hypothetical protein [Sphingomonas sp. ID1715]